MQDSQKYSSPAGPALVRKIIGRIIPALLLTGCASYNQGLYRSIYGNWLTLKSASSFHYEDVIPLGDWDKYVYADGTYSERNDTLFLTYTSSNSDSIYHNGKKISYTLPGYVVRQGKGFLIRSGNGEERFLQHPH